MEPFFKNRHLREPHFEKKKKQSFGEPFLKKGYLWKLYLKKGYLKESFFLNSTLVNCIHKKGTWEKRLKKKKLPWGTNL